MLHINISRITISLFVMFVLPSALVTCVLGDDNDGNMITVQWIKKIKAPQGMLASRPSESLMYSCHPDECYLPEKMSSWRENQSQMDKYSFVSNSLDSFSFDFNFTNKRTTQRQSDYLSLVRFGNGLDRITSVSFDEQYILFRLTAFTSELYELQTSRHLLENIEDEMIIGFDLSGNIYCHRPSMDNMFLLRDIQTGDVLRTYNTELLADDLSWKADNRLNYQPYLIPQTTSDGRYTVFYLISNESENKGIVLICDNEKNCVVAKNPVSLGNRYDLRPLIRYDDKFIAIPNGGRGVLVYDFEDHLFQYFSLPSDEKLIEMQNLAVMRGFCFTPDNKIVLWAVYGTDHVYPSFNKKLKPWLFDLKTSERTQLEDFITPEVYTRLFYFNVPHGITITYETMTGQNQLARIDHGRYVFWDFKTKKRIFETEAKYLPNIVVSPDGNHVYLTSTERSFEEYQGVPRMLATVDVFEIR